MWRGLFCWVLPINKELQIAIDCWGKGTRISLCQDGPPRQLSSAHWSAGNTQTTQMDSAGCISYVCMCFCIHIHVSYTYVTNTIKETEIT